MKLTSIDTSTSVLGGTNELSHPLQENFLSNEKTELSATDMLMNAIVNRMKNRKIDIRLTLPKKPFLKKAIRPSLLSLSEQVLEPVEKSALVLDS